MLNTLGHTVEPVKNRVLTFKTQNTQERVWKYVQFNQRLELIFVTFPFYTYIVPFDSKRFNNYLLF